MKIVIILSLLIFITSCNSTKPVAVVAPISLANDDLTYLFVTHGIGRHCIGHSAILTNEISRQLRLTRKKPAIDLVEECQTNAGRLSYPEGQKEICFKMKNCVTLQHDIVAKRRLANNKIIDNGTQTIDYGYLVVWDLLDEDGRLALRVFELTWSAATESTKRKFLGTDFKRKSNFTLNDSIHNDLINSALSDAILYLGKFKQHIQVPFYDAICYMSLDKSSLFENGKLKSKCSFKDVFASQLNILKELQVEGVTCDGVRANLYSKPDLTESKTEIAKYPRIYSVTASLGSRIFFDILNDLYSFDSEKNELYELRKMHGLTHFKNFGSHLALSGIIFQSRIKNHYLLANQIPLLELVNLSQPEDVLEPQGLKQLTSDEISLMDSKYGEVLVNKACTKDELEALNRKKEDYWDLKRKLSQSIDSISDDISNNQVILNSRIVKKGKNENTIKFAADDFISNSMKAKQFLFTEISNLLKPHERAFEQYRKNIDEPQSPFKLLFSYYSVNDVDFGFLQGASIVTEWVKQFNFFNSSDIEYVLLHLISKRTPSNGNTVLETEIIFRDEILKVFASDLNDEGKTKLLVQEREQVVEMLFSNIGEEYYMLRKQSDSNLESFKKASNSNDSIGSMIFDSHKTLEALKSNRTEIQINLVTVDKEIFNVQSKIEKANHRYVQISNELGQFQDSFKFLGNLVSELNSDIQLISISDPGDILNYELDKDQDWTSNYTFYQEIQNIPIEVDSSFRIPFLYSDIVDSHSNYIRDPKVAWYIACGVNNPSGVKICLNKKPEEIKGVAEWEKK